MKKRYLQPKVEVTLIYTEEGIAANSAKVYPYDNGNYIQDEWTQEADDTRNIDW